MKKAGKLLLLLVIILTGWLRITYLMEPVDLNDHTTINLRVEPGSTGRQITSELYQKGIIKSKLLFNLLLAITGLDDSLKAGFYQLQPSYNVREVMSILVDGRVSTFKLTIPEGFTVEEIAVRLAEKTSFSKDDYLKIAARGFDKPYLAKKPGIKYVLEGYLYPDTYIIPRDFTPEKIFLVMLNQFEKRWWNKLKEETSNNYSPQEIMVIASLIEKEAKLKEEKPLIAAVIYNRLKNEMLLQLDASIQYILPVRKSNLLYRDLEVNSLYNTYLLPGLPPGPICSPGKASIEAALNPAEVDYFFYFAMPDGSHKFTKTYQEHLKLQKELLKDE